MGTCSTCFRLVRQHRVKAYYLLFALLFVLILLSAARPLSLSQWGTVLFFTAVTIAFESRLVALSENRAAITLVSGVLLAESTNLGLFAMLCSLALSLPGLLFYYRSRDILTVVFNISQYGVSSALALLAYQTTGGVIGHYSGAIWSVVTYVMIYAIANYTFVIVAFVVIGQPELRNLFHNAFGFQALVLFLLEMVTGIFIGLAYQAYRIPGMMGLVVVLWLLGLSYQKYFQVAVEARTDELTGLLNRKGFQRELVRRMKTKSGFSIFMLDLDHFKNVNDSLGHLHGDKVIRTIARILTDELGSKGIVARYGGEEFCSIVYLDANDAYFKSEKLRQAILSWSLEKFGSSNPGIQVSASIGIASYPQHGEDYETLLEHADQALYQAKVQRNQVIMYQETQNYAVSNTSN